MDRPLNIAIVGGGIGGASAALALHAHGCGVKVYEQAPLLREAGAGVGLSPNGLLPLYRLGLKAQLNRAGVRYSTEAHMWTGEIVARDDFSGDDDPDGERLRPLTFHRRELLQIIVDALPPDTIEYGRRCIGLEPSTDGVTVHFDGGGSIRADAVIGADGIHSVVQRSVVPPSPPTSEGVMAYRALIPMDRLSWADPNTCSIWSGPNKSFLCFPVSGGAVMNMVAFVPTTSDAEESWSARGEISALAAEYEGWAAPVRETIEALDETYCWGIFDRAPLPNWSKGRITLMGDAAHPMVPYMAQGANQAIEDACTLGVLLEQAAGPDIADRFQAYEAVRRDRTSMVQAGSRQSGRLARDASLSMAARKEKTEELFSTLGASIYAHDAEKVALRAR